MFDFLERIDSRIFRYQSVIQSVRKRAVNDDMHVMYRGCGKPVFFAQFLVKLNDVHTLDFGKLHFTKRAVLYIVFPFFQVSVPGCQFQIALV